MRFGITSPIVTLTARGHGPWEVAAGPGELREVARVADRLGYAHLTCSEHVGIPTDVVPTRGGRYYDPLSTFGYLAAFTERIRLVTHVVVLPYHHPLEVVKRYGTLDRICGGRLVLGVGVGSLDQEFRLLDVDFEGRGPRYEDAIRAIRASFGQREPSYHGTHYRYSDFVIDPCSPRQDVPIWLGGKTARSLRRALELADGWDPFYLTADELAVLLQKARSWQSWRERIRRAESAGSPHITSNGARAGIPPGFSLVFSPEQVFDVMDEGQRDAMRRLARRYFEIGASALSVRFRSQSLTHYLDQLETFAREVAPEFADSTDL